MQVYLFGWVFYVIIEKSLWFYEMCAHVCIEIYTHTYTYSSHSITEKFLWQCLSGGNLVAPSFQGRSHFAYGVFQAGFGYPRNGDSTVSVGISIHATNHHSYCDEFFSLYLSEALLAATCGYCLQVFCLTPQRGAGLLCLQSSIKQRQQLGFPLVFSRG